MAKTASGPDMEKLAEADKQAASKPIESDATINNTAELDRLAALETELKAALDKINELESEVENQAGLKYRPQAKPYAGENGGYKFVVVPKYTDPKLSHLKPMEVTCCDESEAIRWYCEANESHPGSGLALDTVTIGLQLTAKCLDESRKASILIQKKLAAIRNKLERNMAMSDEDEQLMQQYEAKIFGY